jgi:hypothetical protein
MIVAGRALGDNCGANPCGFFDYVWVSDECQAYLSCANLPPMTFSGQIGAGVHDIISGAGSAVVTGITGTATPSDTLSSAVGDALIIGAVVVAALVLVAIVKH